MFEKYTLIFCRCTNDSNLEIVNSEHFQKLMSALDNK